MTNPFKIYSADSFGDIWDLVGPLTCDAFGDPYRVSRFFKSIIKHIDIHANVDVIVDLAGLPQTLKQRTLDTVL